MTYEQIDDIAEAGFGEDEAAVLGCRAEAVFGAVVTASCSYRSFLQIIPRWLMNWIVGWGPSV